MAASGAKKVVDHWAKKAFKKSHKGRLHRRLGVDPSKPIPAAKLRAALAGKYGSEARKEALADHNINE